MKFMHPFKSYRLEIKSVTPRKTTRPRQSHDPYVSSLLRRQNKNPINIMFVWNPFYTMAYQNQIFFVMYILLRKALQVRFTKNI